MGEGGSRPGREQGCVWWLEEVWELPAGGAGREQPQRGWQAGWGRRRTQWGEKDLEKETQKLNIYTQSGPSHDAISARTDLPVVTCSMEKYTYSYDMMSGVFNVLQHTSNFDTTMSHYGRLDFNNPMRNKPVHSEREGQASEK